MSEVHRVHAGYTLLARLKRDRAETVNRLLEEMRAQPERLPFADSPTTHFATVTVIPAQAYGDDELPATLLVATSFCGPARLHLEELVRVMGHGLRELLDHCEDFPSGCSDEELWWFLEVHRHPDTFYSGMQHLTRDDVVRQQRLRNAIEAFIDERQRAGGLAGGPLEIRREIQEHVESRPDLVWARDEPWAPPPGTWLALHGRTLLVYAVALPFLAALLVGSTALLFSHATDLRVAVASGWGVFLLLVLTVLSLVLGVREAEAEQTFVAGRQPDDHVRRLAATQNRPVINEMTIAGPIKEGTTRPWFLRIALWIVARVAEGLPGLRPGIHIPTVATARWIAADQGRRLIFISNYTNASEPYVRDFIDVDAGAKRINLTFGFGRGYPKTEWIIERGAVEDPNSFIHVVNANQLTTAFWFCPYRNISIDNIRILRQIREGLFGPCTEEQARAWLQLL